MQEFGGNGKSCGSRCAILLHQRPDECRVTRSPAGDLSGHQGKMELVGNYKNAGQQWCPKGDAIEVLTRDFPDPEVPKAVPDSVDDVGQSIGSVNAGMISDTAELAVESICQWWRNMGRPRYSRTCRLLICADSKGSNGHCPQLWKRERRAFPLLCHSSCRCAKKSLPWGIRSDMLYSR